MTEPERRRGFLDGWADIAAELRVSASCAMEWAKRYGLPVYTLGEGPGARVRLDLADLDDWQAARKAKTQRGR